MSREETERNYQRLMMEHLQLQKSHTLLQTQSNQMQDPQREARGEVKTLLKEREINLSNLRASQRKIDKSEGELLLLQRKLNEAMGRVEDLEFQLMEMEQQTEDPKKSPPCSVPTTPPCVDARWTQASPAELREESGHTERVGGDGADQSECQSECDREDSDNRGLHQLLDALGQQQQKLQVNCTLGPDMERLRTDLAALLKGKGKEAESLLKRFDNLTQEEKSRSEALECMARELQMKVINLQQEMDSPQKKQGQTKAQKPSKADNSVSAALEREKQENLELKAEIKKLTHSEHLLLDIEKQLREELSNCRSQYEHLQYQLNTQTQSPTPALQVKTETSVQTTNSHLSPARKSPSSLSELTRKNSKDRKSRPRSGDDPTATKRRRSSYEVCSENDVPPVGLKSARSMGDLKPGAYFKSNHSELNSCKNINNLEGMAQGFGEQNKENQDVAAIREELLKFRAENMQLKDQLNRRSVETSTEAEANYGEQHMLLERMARLESETGFLRMENETLKARVRHQRLHEDSASDSGSVGQITDMEECLESLREQVEAREAAERQLRERLRLVESSAEEAEAAEMAAREKYEALLAREGENSRQVRQMQQTCRELTDILVDKDIMEQGLTDKVDFLQRAEAAAVQRVEELEVENKDLRAQLQEAARLADDLDSAGPGGASQRQLNKIQELKHQMTFLETDNRALQARVAELEENEETLRENWRRVAEEDFSRIQSLDEKVKKYENLNKQLKADLADAQEYFVINAVPEASLAAELAHSQSQLTSASDDTTGGQQDAAEGGGPDGEDVHLSGMMRKDSEKRTLRDKLQSMERQLSDVVEKKNSTIENLQEKIVSMKENEIKLSETISEMEMTEREIRAKLALYESSEITVEKMLKYQSKIEELRTSQESLLDQIETMENQEMTLQEKMQEMERTLRGKIVTLEVEIKGFKTRELKDAAKIRELEKLEKELSEKTVQQAEKENGLYIKISSLMEQLKAAKEQVETLREQLTDKEDKVRKAKLLEVKFLEIEMEFGKKMSDLSSKLRHKEEELRQKEVAHEEEMSAMKEEMSMKDTEHNSMVSKLEEKFLEKEKEIEHTVESLNKKIDAVASQRDSFESQLADVRGQNIKLNRSQSEFVDEISSLKEVISRLNLNETESQGAMSELQESLQIEKGLTEKAEREVKHLEEELEREREKVAVLEREVNSLKADLTQKTKTVDQSCEKEKELEKEKQGLSNELDLKNERVSELEKQLQRQSEYMADLEAKYKQLKADSDLLNRKSSETEAEHEKKLEAKQNQINVLESSLSAKEKEFEEENSLLKSKCQKLEADINSLTADQVANRNSISKLETEIKDADKKHTEEVASLENEQKMLQQELRNKILFLNTQLNTEVQSRESEQSALQDSNQREQNLSSEITKLKKEIEVHKRELVGKLSELEEENKEKCEISLQMSNLKHSYETLRHEFETFKEGAAENEKKLKMEIVDQSINMDKLISDLDKAKSDIQQMEIEIAQKDNLVAETGSEKDKLVAEKQAEISKLFEENACKEQMVQEHIQKSESAVLLSKQEHKTEMDNLRQRLAEEEEQYKQLEEDKQGLDVRVEDLESQVETLELYLSEVNFKLDSKSSQCRKREEELEAALVENDKTMSEVKKLREQLEHLKSQLDKKHAEVAQKATENFDSLSLISAKQQELEKARADLQKTSEDKEHYKTLCQSKEEEVIAKEYEHQQLSFKFENLSKQYHQRDLDYKEMESKVTGVKIKLDEAESRCRELEAKCAGLERELDKQFSQAQQGENILKDKETENENLKSKLADFKESIDFMTEEMEKLREECEVLRRELDNSHKEISEMDCAVVNKNKEYEEIKSKYSELESANEQIKRSLADSEIVYSEYEAIKEKLFQTEEKLQTSENTGNQLKHHLNTVEDELALSNQQVSELTGKLHLLQETLEKKETSHRDTESGLQTLEQQLLEAKIESQSLRSKVAHFQETNNQTQALCDQSEERLKEVELALDQSREEILELQNTLSEKGKSFDQLVAELEMAKAQLLSTQEQSKQLSEKLRDLDEQGEQLQINNAQISQSEMAAQIALSEKSAVCLELENELEALKENTTQNQEEVRDAKLRLENIMLERNNLQEKCACLEGRLSATESEKSSMASEYQEKIDKLILENRKLKVQSEEALNDLSSVQSELEKSRDTLEVSLADIQEKLVASQAQNDQRKADIMNLQKELDNKQEEKHALEMLRAEHEKTVKDLKATIKEQEAQEEKHRGERQTLESRLQEAESMCQELRSDLDTFKEEMSNSAQALSQLEDQLQDKCSENEVLQSRVVGLENTASSSKDYKEMEKRMEMLQREVEEFKKSDSINEEKLNVLGRELNGIREREHRMSHRVEELEGREKELLEQMADIEATVIVPLETENQELKDEIGIMKQERDEAIAKLGSWGDDNHDVDAQQADENVHKCLEDALMQREELEKKVVILSDDITMLETERDTLRKKIADLHASSEDMAEKCEILEIEVERLKELEKQTSVVEETETRLMDQVLDLEEREHRLTSELKVLKQKELMSVGSQTDELEITTERLQYLEQKVEVLQDAESRYMDSIMELEEAKAYLEAQLKTKDTDSSNQTVCLTSNTDSSSSQYPSTSTLVTSYASINLERASPETEMPVIPVSASMVEATYTKIEPQEDSSSNDVTEVQQQNKKLLMELEESSEKINQLNLKLELLQDSEARLMERLLELEEKSERDRPPTPKIKDTESQDQAFVFSDEVKHKIESLKEENEFLAESVENYKQLYKEEKEKSNRLQEKVLEDSSVFHDLEEAREELSALQCKMDNVLAEYDEHMAEKEKSEADLSVMLEQSKVREEKLQLEVHRLQIKEEALQEMNANLELKYEDVERQVLNLENTVSDLQLKESKLQHEVGHLRDNESYLQQQVNAAKARERAMEHQVQELERKIQEHRSRLEEQHSVQSDSGVSGDGYKASSEQNSRQVRYPAPVIEESFSSKTSIQLSRPPVATSPPQITSEPAFSSQRFISSPTHNISTTSSPNSAYKSVSHARSSPPVAPPRTRGRRSRPTSIDSVSQEELVFLVEELQAREAVLKKRVLDLEAITDVDLPQRVEELERENRQLQMTLDHVRKGIPQEQNEEVAYVSLTNPSYFYAGSDSNNNSSSSSDNNRRRREQAAMLDKPGEVLQQRVKELEHLDAINKNQ
ncbi:hypothetical protein PoB_005713700, partial [Plakobranchus ocellatus]